MANTEARYRRRYRQAQERRVLRRRIMSRNHDRGYADPRAVRWATARLGNGALRTLVRYPLKIAGTVARMQRAHGLAREAAVRIPLGDLSR